MPLLDAVEERENEDADNIPNRSLVYQTKKSQSWIQTATHGRIGKVGPAGHSGAGKCLVRVANPLSTPVATMWTGAGDTSWGQ